ncbi:YmfQ family protein [Alkaliphilus sp. B6464]|uniref:YmfQ family protein n=1 Tax=Alkaliphilus sp. B6464 TaxID=2731219 RepID=UPI001BA4680B|nr:YmfQ family protein [Alkaliphilus sp. B6464]QUH21410.1 YmfQ family protein [Alkaliphilus sp. B6464]
MYGQYKYGEHRYGEEGTSIDEIDLLTPNLMKYLPWYYHESKTMKEIQESISKEFGLIAYYTEDVYRQFFIDTATWGLSIYESELDLKTNMSLSYEERREIIKAKWRGRGTTTKQMIKNTAEAFSGGEVDVIEYLEEDYFIVKFIGVKGIPKNMQGFIDMLETIKPAHLAYEFKYSYTTCEMLIAWNVTCSDLKSITCTELKTYEKF